MLSVVVNSVFDDYILVVDPNDINHIKNVYRKVKGDILRAVDGNCEYLCEIEFIDDKEIKLKVLEKVEDNFSLEVELEAAISILKGDKMDLTIQKLTEIGVSKIIPLSTKRCVVKLDRKKDRWDLISKEAMKQCQAVAPTIIDEIKKIENLNLKEYDLIIVPYENEENLYIKNIFKSLTIRPKKILYVIGPEGGFEEKEIENLKNNGAKIVSLGKRILRAETAAIVTGGVIINEFF